MGKMKLTTGQQIKKRLDEKKSDIYRTEVAKQLNRSVMWLWQLENDKNDHKGNPIKLRPSMQAKLEEILDFKIEK